METTSQQVMALRVQEIPPANTIEETAVVLRFRSSTSIYEMLTDGRLRSVVIGGKRLVTGASIIELLRISEQATYTPTREPPKKRAQRERAAA